MQFSGRGLRFSAFGSQPLYEQINPPLNERSVCEANAGSEAF